MVIFNTLFSILLCLSSEVHNLTNSYCVYMYEMQPCYGRAHNSLPSSISLRRIVYPLEWYIYGYEFSACKLCYPGHINMPVASPKYIITHSIYILVYALSTTKVISVGCRSSNHSMHGFFNVTMLFVAVTNILRSTAASEYRNIGNRSSSARVANQLVIDAICSFQSVLVDYNEHWLFTISSFSWPL